MNNMLYLVSKGFFRASKRDFPGYFCDILSPIFLRYSRSRLGHFWRSSFGALVVLKNQDFLSFT